jgi:hypothetical protein
MQSRTFAAPQNLMPTKNSPRINRGELIFFKFLCHFSHIQAASFISSSASIGAPTMRPA